MPPPPQPRPPSPFTTGVRRAVPPRHRGEGLEVDLVDDARPGWHDAQVGEGGLRPAQELVALAVALVLAGHVEGEGVAGPIAVDLDGVVDDEGGWGERVDPRRVGAEGGTRG